MVKKSVVALLVALLSMVSVECSAVGFGVRAGVSGRYLDFRGRSVEGNVISASPRIGFNVGIYTDIKIVGFGFSENSASGLYIRPEGIFSMSGFDIGGGDESRCRVRMQSVDIPILVSVKFGFLRLYAGPTLTAMDKNKTFEPDGMDMSSIRPFVNYTAGAGLDIGMFTIDMRYDGVFKQPVHSIRIGEMTTGANVRSRFGGWAVSVGVAF